ncbi:MAG TPA: thioredoxin family protein [Dermatophilaceae bacterium]|nr:thioredoxin family protein [Dermatophilaceae bacterium]
MNVSLLYFEGCPSWHEADDRLRQALDTTGHVDTTIRYVLVSTPEEAERLQFRGSPTVLVDDVDPFAEPGSAVGLACRLYPTEDGGRAGSPTLEQLINALS